MLFDFDGLPREKRAKLLLSTVVPRPIAWVVTRDEAGRVNAAPFSFFNVMGSNPPTLALGIARRPAGLKDTAANIKATGEFVVNLVPHRLAEAMNLTSFDAESGVDEIAAAGLTAQPSHRVAPPRIGESPVAMECKVMTLIEQESGHTIVLGEVLAMHLAEEAVMDVERCYIDTPALDLIGRMHGGGWYSRTTERFDMPRPAGINRYG
ncbi:flavin reductase family protein [Acetobacteraceae bacterium H6797]|nr:flavin reductase family protein [Acetobacteraceae bacterium H6797]